MAFDRAKELIPIEIRAADLSINTFFGYIHSSQNFQLQSSNPNAGTDIQLASAETALSAAANTGGTTIINNYSASSGDGSRSVANQVDFGPSNADMGGDLFTNTRIRTLVA